MKKKSKTSIIVAVILGVLCAAMIALCVLVFMNGFVGKLNQKAITEKKSDFKETEETGDNAEYEGNGENFEIVVRESAQTEENNTEETADYLCPETSERELTESDVTALQSKTVEGLPEGKDIIQMVINEMYAKKGYQFTDTAIQDYFNSKTWYQEIAEKTDDMDAVFNGMSDVEKANVEFLQPYVQ